MIGDDDDDAEGGWGAGGMAGADGADGEDGDFDPCNICVAGDPVDLVPSKGGYNDFVDLGGKLAPFDGDPCADVPTPANTKTADSADSDTKSAIMAKTTSTKNVGEKCETKADVDTSVNMCVAGKVVKK
jgi:hypothetical protein